VDTLRQRQRNYEASTIAGSVLVPVGVAALATGAALYYLGVKQSRRAEQLTPIAQPVKGGATLSLAWSR
jgi:hypothetical protein